MLSYIRRKIRWIIEYLQNLQTQVNTISSKELRQDFTIDGSAPELQTNIVAYVADIFQQIVDMGEYSEHSAGQIVVIMAEWPMPGWPDIQQVYIESSNPNNNGYYDVDSFEWAEPYLTINAATFPGEAGEISVFFVTLQTTYKVQTAEELTQNIGEQITIQGSDNCDGTYQIINKEIIDADYLVTLSPNIPVPPVTNLGEVYSVPGVNDTVFVHNFNSNFIDIEVYYSGEKQNEDFQQNYIEQADNNTLVLLSSQFGQEQIGQTGKIYIKKLD